MCIVFNNQNFPSTSKRQLWATITYVVLDVAIITLLTTWRDFFGYIVYGSCGIIFSPIFEIWFCVCVWVCVFLCLSIYRKIKLYVLQIFFFRILFNMMFSITCSSFLLLLYWPPSPSLSKNLIFFFSFMYLSFRNFQCCVHTKSSSITSILSFCSAQWHLYSSALYPWVL